jgi:hypothetical protein
MSKYTGQTSAMRIENKIYYFLSEIAIWIRIQPTDAYPCGSGSETLGKTIGHTKQQHAGWREGSMDTLYLSEGPESVT